MENLEVMVTLFIIVILGYVLCKLGYMGDKFDQKLSTIVIDITCPSLILSSVMGDTLPDRTLILPLLGVSILTYIILLAFGFFVPRFIAKDHDAQGMIGFTLMFANVGFIGYPIVASIFGPHAIFYAALLNMPNTFFIFTAGVMLIKGEYSIKQLNPKILFSPAMIAAFAAALLVAFNIRTPELIAKPVTMVGQHNGSGSADDNRFVDGTSAATRHHRHPEGLRGIAIETLHHSSIAVFPIQGSGSERSGDAINTVVIAMPAASYGTMFCLKYGRNPALMTEITFITTVASIFTIPMITLLFK